MFQPASKTKKRYDISRATLASWGDSGKIRIRRLGDGGRSGKRIYHVGDVDERLGPSLESAESKHNESYIYARVSSSKQATDLVRQVKDLQGSYPDHKTLKDIGSGLNYRRKNFQALLGRVHAGNVQ